MLAVEPLQEVRLRLWKVLPRGVRTSLNSVLGRGAAPSRRKGSKSTLDLPRRFGPVRVLSSAPPIFLSGMPYRAFLGIASEFARHYGNVNAGFIIYPTWTIEKPHLPKAIRRAHATHSALYPNHRFLFICNTPTETRLLADLGLPAVFLNKNFLISDQIFRPIENSRADFDAVYNARFTPPKRHELAAAIPRVGYLSYVGREPPHEFRDLCAAVLARNPAHVLLNELVDGLPTRMSHDEVNAALGRAAVGLVLSEVEGTSNASMEYLLAGLPVVSTPSMGGRDVFFDSEYCIVCEPNPAAVRDAVASLRARNIPRAVIRARTLAKIQPLRERFLALVNDLAEELGGERRYSDGAWPFGDVSGVPWRPFEEHLAAFAERQHAEPEGGVRI